MKFSSMRFFMKDALNSIFRNMTISIASLFTITVTLMIMGMIALIFANANHYLGIIQNKIDVDVYLKNGLDDAAKNTIKEEISKYDGISGIKFISKDDAMKSYNEMMSKNGNKSSVITDSSVMPESFRVSFKDISNVEKFTSFAEKIKNTDGVKTDATLVDKILKFSKNFNIISTIILMIFIIVSLSLIVNNIKLAVFSRRKEIGIMKFVGATDGFIRWPFIFEGIMIGIIGAIFASIILYFSYRGLYNISGGESAGMYKLLDYSIVVFPGSLAFMLVGSIIGTIGSVIAIRKFLRV